MPNETKTNDTKIDETKPTLDAPAPVAEAPAEPVRNLTREAIELQIEGQHIAAGKSKAEAKKLAKARALEMIPEDAK